MPNFEKKEKKNENFLPSAWCFQKQKIKNDQANINNIKVSTFRNN